MSIEQPSPDEPQAVWDKYYRDCFRARLAELEPEPWLVLKDLTDREKIVLLQQMTKCFYLNWLCEDGDKSTEWHCDPSIDYVLDFAKWTFDIHDFENQDFCATLKEPK